MTNDTPTYRIKPLVWDNADGVSFKAHGMLGARISVWYHTTSGWLWNIELGNFDDVVDEARGIANAESAKSAAESAYRALVAEHLDEVK